MTPEEFEEHREVLQKSVKRLENETKNLKKARTSGFQFFPDFAPSGRRYKKGFWNRLFGRTEKEWYEKE